MEISAAQRENSGDAARSSEESVKSNLFPVRTEWTDEKHNLYLTCMESSFIDQLYNEHGSNDLLGCLSIVTPKPTKDLGSNSNCLLSCQFKCLHKGCWQTLNFERKRTRFEIKKETWNLFANPWIQHFTSRNRPLNRVDCNELVSRAIHSGISTSTKRQRPYCSRIWRQDSTGTNAEVSDQNFVGIDSEGENQTRMIRRKRAKTENIKSPVKDSST